MSVHLIYYEGAKKKMRPIQSREEYMKLRHSTPHTEQRGIYEATSLYTPAEDNESGA